MNESLTKNLPVVIWNHSKFIFIMSLRKRENLILALLLQLLAAKSFSFEGENLKRL